MSIGAGTAIPGGLFVPSILVRRCSTYYSLAPNITAACRTAPPAPAASRPAPRVHPWPQKVGSQIRAHQNAPPPAPAAQAGATSGGLLGAWLRVWLPGWNIQPGLYSLMAATATLGGVFRRARAGGEVSASRGPCAVVTRRCLCPAQNPCHWQCWRWRAHYPLPLLQMVTNTPRHRRNSISLVVLVMEGTRSIEYMGGIILSVG